MVKKNLALIIVSLGLGLFMAMLDGTIVNISIPAMMKDFGVGIGSISWVLDAYLLVLAVLALTVGRLADRYGRKRVYIIGVSIFTIASLLCALARDVNWLIAFRVLQGIGAAIMISVSMAIMTSSFPAEKRGTAMGIWAAVGITAAAGGAVFRRGNRGIPGLELGILHQCPYRHPGGDIYDDGSDRIQRPDK